MVVVRYPAVFTITPNTLKDMISISVFGVMVKIRSQINTLEMGIIQVKQKTVFELNAQKSFSFVNAK